MAEDMTQRVEKLQKFMTEAGYELQARGLVRFVTRYGLPLSLDGGTAIEQVDGVLRFRHGDRLVCSEAGLYKVSEQTGRGSKAPVRPFRAPPELADAFQDVANRRHRGNFSEALRAAMRVYMALPDGDARRLLLGGAL
jgi:hypothetical protein